MPLALVVGGALSAGTFVDSSSPDYRRRSGALGTHRPHRCDRVADSAITRWCAPWIFCNTRGNAEGLEGLRGGLRDELRNEMRSSMLTPSPESRWPSRGCSMKWGSSTSERHRVMLRLVASCACSTRI